MSAEETKLGDGSPPHGAPSTLRARQPQTRQALTGVIGSYSSRKRLPASADWAHFNESGKKTGQICRREKSSVSDLELGSLAGFFALIWSNLCTRYIQKKLTPRGHHDWPDKRVIQPSGAGHINFRLAPLKRLTLLVYPIGGTLA